MQNYSGACAIVIVLCVAWVAARLMYAIIVSGFGKYGNIDKTPNDIHERIIEKMQSSAGSKPPAEAVANAYERIDAAYTEDDLKRDLDALGVELIKDTDNR